MEHIEHPKVLVSEKEIEERIKEIHAIRRIN